MSILTAMNDFPKNNKNFFIYLLILVTNSRLIKILYSQDRNRKQYQQAPMRLLISKNDKTA